MGTELERLAYQYVTGRTRARVIRSATARNERYALGHFTRAMGGRKAVQVGQSDVERWLGTMAALSPGTVRARYSIAKRFVGWLVDTGVIRRSPFRMLTAPKVPRSRHRALSSDQAGALVAACRDPRDLLIVELGFQLGLRRAEVAGIEVGDITWGSRPTLLVHGKGGHERVLPLTKATVAAVNHYLSSAPANGGPLLRNERHPSRGITPDYVGRIFQRIALDAGVKHQPRDGVSFHATRHTAATDVWEETGNITAVQHLLGHRSLATTEVYVDTLNVEALRGAMEGRTYGGKVVELVSSSRRAGERSVGSGSAAA